MNDNKQCVRVEVKDPDKGTVSAIFSTFDVIDKDGDVTRPDAFTDGQAVVISSWQHTSWDGAPPLGKGKIRSTKTEAVMDGRFFLDTKHGADAFTVVKELSADGLQEWSYSLHDVKASFGQQDGQEVRFLESIRVKEVSPVLIGAGVGTRTLSIKSGSMKYADERDAVLTAVRELGARAKEVVTLRAEQGKSAVTVNELYEAIFAEAQALKAWSDEHTTTPPDEALKAEARALYLSFVSLTQGA